MIDVSSFFASGMRYVSPPENGNIAADVRPLTLEDMNTIIDEHGVAIGAAIDAFAQIDNPVTFLEVLWQLPEVQRWIVWYGSNLKRWQVDELHIGRPLFEASLEVILTTKAAYSVESVTQLLVERLQDFSDYLKNASPCQ